jgi:hypothetical protein
VGATSGQSPQGASPSRFGRDPPDPRRCVGYARSTRTATSPPTGRVCGITDIVDLPARPEAAGGSYEVSARTPERNGRSPITTATASERSSPTSPARTSPSWSAATASTRPSRTASPPPPPADPRRPSPRSPLVANAPAGGRGSAEPSGSPHRPATGLTSVPLIHHPAVTPEAGCVRPGNRSCGHRAASGRQGQQRSDLLSPPVVHLGAATPSRL